MAASKKTGGGGYSDVPSTAPLAQPGKQYVLGPMNSGKVQRLAMTPEVFAQRRKERMRARIGHALRSGS
jgi:hypothetical protein